MQPHQERVLTEVKELDLKRNKLRSFLKGEMVKSLPIDEQYRLGRQLSIMDEYAEILRDRIAHFPK